MDSVRDLRVQFDPSLNFKRQINSLVKNCSYHNRNLYAIKTYLDQQILLTLLHSLVMSRIDYCSSLYVGLPRYLLGKLQSVLNRTTRLVFSAPPRSPTTSLLIELHWLPVVARIEFKICLIVYKVINFGEPKYLAEFLSPPIEFGMSIHSGRSFSYAAPRLYNHLPVQIKQRNSVDSFKKNLKTFLFSQAYNSDDGTMNEGYRI